MGLELVTHSGETFSQVRQRSAQRSDQAGVGAAGRPAARREVATTDRDRSLTHAGLVPRDHESGRGLLLVAVVADQVRRPRLGDRVQPSDVVADHAQADELQGAQAGDGDDDRTALYGTLRLQPRRVRAVTVRQSAANFIWRDQRPTRMISP